MRVLIVGSGGREHALVWKISQSRKVNKIFSAPGNGGIKELAEIVNIKVDDIDGLLNFAKDKNIDLTVAGPELPLVKGIVDRFNDEGLKIFGPTKNLAMLEGSKIFSKQILQKYNIPTAQAEIFNDPNRAIEFIKKNVWARVVKADGLAAGKGVIVCDSEQDAINAVEKIMVDKAFGDAGNKVL